MEEEDDDEESPKRQIPQSGATMGPFGSLMATARVGEQAAIGMIIT